MKKIEYVKGILVGAVFAATIAVTMLAVPSARADTDLEGTAQAKPLYTMVVNNSRDGLPFKIELKCAEGPTVDTYLLQIMQWGVGEYKTVTTGECASQPKEVKVTLGSAVAKFTAEAKEGATFGYPQITGTNSMRAEYVKGPSGEIVQLILN